MDAKQSVQIRHYEQFASDYDRVYNRENSNHLYKISEIARVLFENLRPRPQGYDILEVGAGTGIHAQHFLTDHRTQIRRYTASDISGAMLERAKERLASFDCVDYLVSPAESLTPERKFDAIFMSGAMHHFSDPKASIDSMKDCLRPGGVLVVCEPIIWNPLNFFRAVVTGVDWGQFIVTRRNVRTYLTEARFKITCDRVLHWKGFTPTLTRLWPYEKLERLSALNNLAIMFLFAAKKPETP